MDEDLGPVLRGGKDAGDPRIGEPAYLEEQSESGRRRYPWSYTVTIEKPRQGAGAGGVAIWNIMMRGRVQEVPRRRVVGARR